MFSRSSVVSTTFSCGHCSEDSGSGSLAAQISGARLLLGAMFSRLSGSDDSGGLALIGLRSVKIIDLTTALCTCSKTTGRWQTIC